MSSTTDGEPRPPAFIDADYAGWLAYHDEIKVHIEFADHPPGFPGAQVADEFWCISTGASQLDLRWMDVQLMKIGGQGSYVLTTTDTKHSWGASGSGAELLLTLSEGLLSAATWDLMLWLRSEIVRRIREERGPEADYEITEDQAVASARWEVQLRRPTSGSPDGLIVKSVEAIKRNHFVIELLDETSGTTYEVESEAVEGAAVFLSRIRKKSFSHGARGHGEDTHE